MASRAPREQWAGRRVLVTGHTGFIGGWLAHVLAGLDAKVVGYADRVPTNPSLFAASGLAGCIEDCRGDIADFERLADTLRRAQPEIIFHLAAQPLVRRAFAEPLATYRSNVMGTLAILEAMRVVPAATAAVLMTTDKVYRNREWIWPYRESDELGGHEPYGLSKAMAELVVEQYRRSYFSLLRSNGSVPKRLVAVRAGNVIGGGDWAEDRLVPDAIRAWSSDRTLLIRSPDAVRPWQHVLDVVDALLRIGARTLSGESPLQGAYNVGPDTDCVVSVGRLVDMLAAAWGDGASVSIEPPAWQAPESRLLTLDSTLLRTDFAWRPRLTLAQSVAWAVDWYKAFADDPSNAAKATQQQVAEYLDVRS